MWPCWQGGFVPGSGSTRTGGRHGTVKPRGCMGRGSGRVTGQGGSGMERARATSMWVLADGISTERGDAWATDAGSARLRCNGNVRARGAGGMAMLDGPRGVSGEGGIWTSTGTAGTVTGDRGDMGITTSGVEAMRGTVWVVWTQEG